MPLDLSKVTATQKILAFLVSLGAFIGLLFSCWSTADERWNEDTQIVTILSDYAKKSEITKIRIEQKKSRHQIDLKFIQAQMQKYQDEIDHIKDLEVDNDATNADLKKLHRYENKVNTLNKEEATLQIRIDKLEVQPLLLPMKLNE